MAKLTTDIILLTRGAAGYVAALSLVNEVPHLAAKIRIVDLMVAPSSAWFNLCSSAFGFHQSLGVAEQEFIVATGARIKYGTRVEMLGKVAGFFSDAAFGAPLEGLSFFQLFTKYVQQNPAATLRDYCLVAQLAAAGKCRIRTRQPDPLDDLINCGYVVGDQAYTDFLRALCKQKNIAFFAVKNIEADVAGDTIQALTCDGTRLLGDLYVDCSEGSGLAAALGLATREIFHSAAPLRVVTTYDVNPSAKLENFGAFVGLAPEGLRYEWLVGSGIGQTYCLEKPSYGGAPAEQGEVAGFAALDSAWVGNCVFLGAASATLPGFIVDDLHRVRSGILRLVNCWPSCDNLNVLAKIFNRRTQEELMPLAAIDDYVLHCAFGAAVPLLPLVEHKLALFHAVGRVPMHEAETLTSDNWQVLFHAFGERVAGSDLLTQAMSDESLAEKFPSMVRFFASVTAKSPSVSDCYSAVPKRNG